MTSFRLANTNYTRKQISRPFNIPGKLAVNQTRQVDLLIHVIIRLIWDALIYLNLRHSSIATFDIACKGGLERQLREIWR